ncbi:restriction endonuclease subunit S [Campylobacter helveticus]|uniref:restriction endonuclease subunit S n=1 Tax=Campylobacter helveticus TaxID=28898 RepID=UPI0009D825AD|nr:restriction endonuclease subunit S [Campylobacter helveticus]MCR2055564.1 restriction endonuclease subunit S [Campylobacter helveticus]SMC20844.1 Type I restriction modification DNA specificity domain-containing protein [Campylobacter helveticus]SUW84124.1 type I restriction modification DNA specificity domain-containing protein [Campylobacter helveticus]
MELKHLGELGAFTRGNGLTKSDFVDSGVPCIHYGQIHTHYHNYTHSTISFVSQEVAKKLKKAKYGDLVISGVSEDKECVCKAVVYLGEQEACVSGDTFIFSHSQNPKFIGYLFQAEPFDKFKKKYAQGAKVLRVHNKQLEKFQIPLPPLEVQRDIVEILDKFDTLTNDLARGLPAEIEARKKQYEYYRERLLDFR